jgi:hypothetical protein
MCRQLCYLIQPSTIHRYAFKYHKPLSRIWNWAKSTFGDRRWLDFAAVGWLVSSVWLSHFACLSLKLQRQWRSINIILFPIDYFWAEFNFQVFCYSSNLSRHNNLGIKCISPKLSDIRMVPALIWPTGIKHTQTPQPPTSTTLQQWAVSCLGFLWCSSHCIWFGRTEFGTLVSC